MSPVEVNRPNLMKAERPNFMRGDHSTEEPQMTEGLPPPSKIPFAEDSQYGNSDEFQSILRKALDEGLDSLTTEQKKQVGQAIEASPELAQMMQEADKGREERQFYDKNQKKSERRPVDALDERVDRYWKESRGFGTIGDENQRHDYFLRTATDILATAAKPLIEKAEKELASIPKPFNSRRNLEEDPPSEAEIQSDRDWRASSPLEKEAHVAHRIAIGAIKAGMEMSATQADMIMNPEKYGTTRGEAVLGAAAGLTDMILMGPDYVAAAAEMAYGTENNPITKLAKAIGIIPQGGKILYRMATTEKEVDLKDGKPDSGVLFEHFTDIRQAIYEEAYQMLEDQPEVLPFSLMMGMGIAKGFKGKRPKPGALLDPKKFKFDISDNSLLNVIEQYEKFVTEKGIKDIEGKPKLKEGERAIADTDIKPTKIIEPPDKPIVMDPSTGKPKVEAKLSDEVAKADPIELAKTQAEADAIIAERTTKKEALAATAKDLGLPEPPEGVVSWAEKKKYQAEADFALAELAEADLGVTQAIERLELLKKQRDAGAPPQKGEPSWADRVVEAEANLTKIQQKVPGVKEARTLLEHVLAIETGPVKGTKPYEMTRGQFLTEALERIKEIDPNSGRAAYPLHKLAGEIGKLVIERVKSADPQKILDYYVKKYNIETRTPISLEMDYIFKNKLTLGEHSLEKGGVQPYEAKHHIKIAKGKYTPEQLAGVLRHEIEHILQEHIAGWPGTAKYEVHETIYDAPYPGPGFRKATRRHMARFDFMETDYIHRAMIKDALATGKLTLERAEALGHFDRYPDLLRDPSLYGKKGAESLPAEFGRFGPREKAVEQVEPAPAVQGKGDIVVPPSPKRKTAKKETPPVFKNVDPKNLPTKKVQKQIKKIVDDINKTDKYGIEFTGMNADGSYGFKDLNPNYKANFSPKRISDIPLELIKAREKFSKAKVKPKPNDPLPPTLPDEVVAGTPEMNVMSNLGHIKRTIKFTEDFLKRDNIPAELRKQQEGLLAEAKERLAKHEAEADKIYPNRKTIKPKEKEGILKKGGKDLLDEVDIARDMLRDGADDAALVNRYGKDAIGVRALTGLDKNGAFSTTYKVNPNHPGLDKWAGKIGEMRRNITEITDAHESQIYDALFKDGADLWKAPEAEVLAAIERIYKQKAQPPTTIPKITVPKRKSKPLRAEDQKAISSLQKRIARLKKARKEANSTEVQSVMDVELKTLEQTLADHMGEQGKLMPDRPKTGLDLKKLQKRSQELADEIAGYELDRGDAASEYVARLRAEYDVVQDVIQSIIDTAGEGAGDGVTTYMEMSEPMSRNPGDWRNRFFGTQTPVEIIRSPRDLNSNFYFRTPELVYQGLNPYAGEIARIGSEAHGSYRGAMDRANEQLNSILAHLRQDIKLRRKGEGVRGYFRYRDDFVNAKHSIFEYLDRKVEPSELGSMKPEVRQAYHELRNLYDGYRQRIIDERVASGLPVPEDWGMTDYMTHLFRGNWRVEEFIGDRWQTLSEGVQQTEGAALKVAKKMTEENRNIRVRWDNHVPPDLTVRMSRRAFDRITGILSGKTEFNRVELKKIFAESGAGPTPSASKFYRFSKERQGMEGFERDLVPVLETYIASTERYIAMTEFKRKATALLEKIDFAKQPELRMDVAEYIDIVSGTKVKGSQRFDNFVQKLPGIGSHIKPMALERWSRGIMLAQALRLLSKPSTAAINRLQTFLTVYPRVGLKTFAWAEKNAFVKKWRDFAVANDVTSYAPVLYSESALSSARLRRYQDVPLTLFKKAEQQNRIAAFLAGYKHAMNPKSMGGLGYGDVGVVGGKAKAVAYGKGMVRLTQFDTSAAGIQPIFRHPAMKMLGQFKPFQFKYIEQIMALETKPQFARALGAHLIAGGTSTVLKPLSWLKVLGLYKVYDALKDQFGQDMADYISFGLPALLEADMSGSLAVDVLPDVDPEKMAEGIGKYISGPAGAFIYDGVRAVSEVLDAPSGEKLSYIWDGTKRLVPATKSAQGMYEMSQKLAGKRVDIKDERGRTIIKDITYKEAATRMAAAMTIRQTLVREGTQLSFRERDARVKVKRGYWLAWENRDYRKALDLKREYNDDILRGDRDIKPISARELRTYRDMMRSERKGTKAERQIPTYNKNLKRDIKNIAEGRR